MWNPMARGSTIYANTPTEELEKIKERIRQLNPNHPREESPHKENILETR